MDKPLVSAKKLSYYRYDKISSLQEKRKMEVNCGNVKLKGKYFELTYINTFTREFSLEIPCKNDKAK